jgi:CDP-diacylglycerol--serine O-phosphatidyltransferase
MQINLRKAMFVLPNLFTISSIFLGLYSMTLSGTDATPAQLHQAALAIFFAIFFDAFDGRVARMTKTQSEFGVQLDSLADVISFGAAPALLVYRWALAPLGFVGFFLCFAFAACGALRLARFNVLAQRGDKGGGRFFVGLPIPLAAGALASFAIAHYRAVGALTEQSTRIGIAVLVALLSFLMVSTVRYRTFKDVRFSPKSLAAFACLCLAGFLVGLATRASYVIPIFMAAYICMGLAESLLGARRPHTPAQLPPSVRAQLEADEALEVEDEDLEVEGKRTGDEYV